HAPLPAHADAEERAQDEELRVARREAGEELDEREVDDVRHERCAPAEAVGEHAEDHRADGTEDQRGRRREDDLRLRHTELRGQAVEHENDDEKVEGIERPTEESGEDGVSGMVLHGRRDCICATPQQSSPSTESVTPASSPGGSYVSRTVCAPGGTSTARKA